MTALDEHDRAKAIALVAPSGRLDLPVYTGSTTDLGYLKAYVLENVSALYGVSSSTFDNATVFTTTLIRDFVHRAIYNSVTNFQVDRADYWNDVGSLFREKGWALCGETSWQLLLTHHSQPI